MIDWTQIPRAFNYVTCDLHGRAARHTTRPVYNDKSGRWSPTDGGRRVDMDLCRVETDFAPVSLQVRPDYDPNADDPKNATTKMIAAEPSTAHQTGPEFHPHDLPPLPAEQPMAAKPADERSAIGPVALKLVHQLFVGLIEAVEAKPGSRLHQFAVDVVKRDLTELEELMDGTGDKNRQHG